MIRISFKNTETPPVEIPDGKLKIERYNIGEVLDAIVNNKLHKIYVLTKLEMHIDAKNASLIPSKNPIHEISFDNKDFTYRFACKELARHTRWDADTIIHFL